MMVMMMMMMVQVVFSEVGGNSHVSTKQKGGKNAESETTLTLLFI
jgi:hypothetical protein